MTLRFVVAVREMLHFIQRGIDFLGTAMGAAGGYAAAVAGAGMPHL